MQQEQLHLLPVTNVYTGAVLQVAQQARSSNTAVQKCTKYFTKLCSYTFKLWWFSWSLL